MKFSSLALPIRIFVCAWAICSVASGQQCPVVSDKYSVTSDDRLYAKAQSIFCDDSVRDSASAQSAAQKAGMTIPVAQAILGLNFEGSSSSSDWTHWKESFCKSNYSEVAALATKNILVDKVTENDVKAMEVACSGLAVRGLFDVPKEGGSFVFRINVAGSEKLHSASIAPASAVSECDVGNPFGVSVWYRYSPFDMDISGKTEEVVCKWNQSQPVLVSVSLDNQGTKAFQLPAIPPTPPRPPQPVWCTRQVRVPLVVSTFQSNVGLVSGPGNSWVGTKGIAQSTQTWSIDFDKSAYPNPIPGLGLTYRCQGAGYGWRGWTDAGKWCYDNQKQQTRIETIDMKLTGTQAKNFSLNLQCHLESIGDTGSSQQPDGSLRCGTIGQSRRLESLYVDLQSSGSCP